MSVPGDLSVVGFDDLDLAQLIDPPLTTVHQPVRRKGEEAVRLLLSAISGRSAERPEHMRLETRLIVRASPGPPPALPGGEWGLTEGHANERPRVARSACPTRLTRRPTVRPDGRHRATRLRGPASVHWRRNRSDESQASTRRAGRGPRHRGERLCRRREPHPRAGRADGRADGRAAGRPPAAGPAGGGAPACGAATGPGARRPPPEPAAPTVAPTAAPPAGPTEPATLSGALTIWHAYGSSGGPGPVNAVSRAPQQGPGA